MKFLLALVALALSLCLVGGLKHDLKIIKDRRNGFFIESFGFQEQGRYEMHVKKVKVGDRNFEAKDRNQLGFLIRHSKSKVGFVVEQPSSIEDPAFDCIESYKGPERIFDKAVHIDTSKDTWFNFTVKAGEEGFYNTYFISCLSETPISFEMLLTQYNIEYGARSYLPEGLSPLPTMYGLFSFIYLCGAIFWVVGVLKPNISNVNRMHKLMAVLAFVKCLSVGFHGMEYHFLKTTGSATGWNYIYYILAGLKGILLFTIIGLIGTGWSFVKPFLSEKDKKIFLLVIPLQILDNIALIIIEESAPGSQEWFTWKDIFRLVDIVCCGAILVPIIWSIKHLREASQVDGKALASLKKLQLFRHFYLMVVIYIYFTRIVVYLVDATLPFRWTWLGPFFSECASLMFFGATGYYFRPHSDNPYFSVDDEIELDTSLDLDTQLDKIVEEESRKALREDN